MEIHVHGASSRTLTGEIGLSEFRNVFAEVFICPKTMELHQKSLRETHLEATVARFEFSSEIVPKPKGSLGEGPWTIGAAPGPDRFTFEFLLNFEENSKRVTVASKWVSRNDF